MAIFQRSLTATAAAATVFAALALPVWAQAPAANVTPAARTAAAPHDHDKAEQVQKLQTALQLTEAQQSDWTSYREALKPALRAKPMDRKSFAKLTTPERIDHMRELRTERNAQAERRAEATKAFYATLTPAQQKTFDAQTLQYGARHHGHHGKQHAVDAAPATAN